MRSWRRETYTSTAPTALTTTVISKFFYYILTIKLFTLY